MGTLRRSGSWRVSVGTSAVKRHWRRALALRHAAGVSGTLAQFAPLSNPWKPLPGNPCPKAVVASELPCGAAPFPHTLRAGSTRAQQYCRMLSSARQSCTHSHLALNHRPAPSTPAAAQRSSDCTRRTGTTAHPLSASSPAPPCHKQTCSHDEDANNEALKGDLPVVLELQHLSSEGQEGENWACGAGLGLLRTIVQRERRVATPARNVAVARM